MGSTLEKVEAILAACSTCRRESFTDELPLHVVYLNAYWIDRTEVTNGQYRECVQAGACAAPTTCDAGVSAYLDLSKENYPVACVSWNDAVAYAAWVGGRLPTEAEWEKSARGTDRRAYPWGDAFDGNRLNFCDRNCAFDWKDTTADDGFAETAPVGSYPAGASPYGALDMAGNVWEWVSDSYTSDYYSNSPPLNPQGPSSGEHRIMRGGSFDSGFRFVRCAKRWLDFRRLTNVGFRVAVESAPSEQ